MARKLFCELHPLCYKISVQKEIFLRRTKDLFGKEKFCKRKQKEAFPHTVKSHASVLVRRLHGVDLQLQINKVQNIKLACEKINGTVIHPGETFSFWRTMGKAGKRQGYQLGLVIGKNGFRPGYGGGLCQMANMIHYLILNSPLTVTELHHHSDALFPDERRRVPFGTGTSVGYNYLDYRFQNTTDTAVQLLVWCDDNDLCGELRSEAPFEHRYKLVEEDHCFKKEGEDYYRNSKVYRLVIRRSDSEQVAKELILQNHSKVMYDHSLIPQDQIRP